MLDAALGLAVAALAYTCGRYAGLRRGGAGALGLFAVLAVGGDVVPALLCTVAPWAVGRVVRAHDTLVETLRGRTAELEAEQESLARLAVAHERARVARELHDIVAHHLAVVVVQAGAGRVAPDPREDPERMARIDRSAEEALSEMSRLAGLLEPDGGMRLHSLIADAEATGLKLQAEGVSDVPPEFDDVAYRVVQEGLTNAIKHAPGSEVSLRLALAGGVLEIELRDRRGAAPGMLAGSGSGLGLQGLRERVELLGGNLQTGPADPGGWRLYAQIPTSQG